MNKHHVARLLVMLTLVLLLVTLTGTALAEIARIITPGGPVKMRKKASAKASVVIQVPNNVYVDADEIGEEWTHITYKNKSGYVMTKYVVTASQLGQGMPQISMSPESPAVGSVIDFNVNDPDAVSFHYSLTYLNDKPVRSSEIPYSAVSYRPRKSGICCLEVTATHADGSTLTNQYFFEVRSEDVSAQLEALSDEPFIFSQKDGWWLDKKYRTSTLDQSGCAIFTLSHALQMLGRTKDSERPENLATAYAFCLVDGGTLNATLIGRAAKNYGFTTRSELIESEKDIAARFDKGALFSFSIVRGHIALACGLSEDGTKVRIIDSAPDATMERITNASLYLPAEDGSWHAIQSLADIPGERYYFETGCFGGATYYLDLSYVAKRGARLIQKGK